MNLCAGCAAIFRGAQLNASMSSGQAVREWSLFLNERISSHTTSGAQNLNHGTKAVHNPQLKSSRALAIHKYDCMWKYLLVAQMLVIQSPCL